MNTGTFSTILFALIVLIGGYLIMTGSVEGRAKMILIVFIVIITILLILNLGLFSNRATIVDSPYSAISTIPPLKSYKYTESFSLTTWVYITDWNLNFGAPKNIIKRNLGQGVQPNMYLDAYENQLNIDYSVYGTTPGSANTSTIHIPNISTQKWVNITCCFSDSNIDTYINGKLVNTTIPTNSLYYPSQPDKNPAVFNICANGAGYSGFISNTYYYADFLTPQDAWNIYKKGYSNNMLGNILNKYNATFTFYENQTQIGDPIPIM